MLSFKSLNGLIGLKLRDYLRSSMT